MAIVGQQELPGAVAFGGGVWTWKPFGGTTVRVDGDAIRVECSSVRESGLIFGPLFECSDAQTLLIGGRGQSGIVNARIDRPGAESLWLAAPNETASYEVGVALVGLQLCIYGLPRSRFEISSFRVAGASNAWLAQPYDFGCLSMADGILKISAGHTPSESGVRMLWAGQGQGVRPSPYFRPLHGGANQSPSLLRAKPMLLACRAGRRSGLLRRPRRAARTVTLCERRWCLCTRGCGSALHGTAGATGFGDSGPHGRGAGSGSC